MGNSASSDEKDSAVELQSDDDKKVLNNEEEDEDLSSPIQHLFYLLRKANVDDGEVKAILNAEGEAKIDLNVADLPPVIDPNANPEDPLVKKLMERIAKKTYLGDFPMHLLVSRAPSANTPELLDLVKLFFLKDHQMNCRNKLGSTPLHRACAAGNAAMANELIKWGAEVDAVNSMQLTCLHMACLSGSSEVVKLLLDNGCAKHINYKCLYGIAPVDYVLKDDVIALLRAARKGHAAAAGAKPAAAAAAPKITEGNEEEAE